jgi:DivIVA domain-containing protein
MPLTPEDVKNKQFTTVRLREGYDEDEVDAFLDEVETELNRLHRDNDDLRARLAQASRGALPPGSVMPTPMVPATMNSMSPVPMQQQMPQHMPVPVQSNQDAAAGILALAQRTADEHIAGAKGEGDKLLNAARMRADQLARDAEERHRQAMGTLEHDRASLERKVEDLRAFEREYRSRLKSYLEGQLRDLDGRSSDGSVVTTPRAAVTSGSPTVQPGTQQQRPMAPQVGSGQQPPLSQGMPPRQQGNGSPFSSGIPVTSPDNSRQPPVPPGGFSLDLGD